MPRFRILVCGLVVLGLISACAGRGTSTGSDVRSTSPATEVFSSTSVPRSSSPSSSTSSSGLLATTMPSRPAVVSPVPSTAGRQPSGPQLTLTGIVDEGVGPKCLVLTDDASGQQFNLTGGAPAIVKPGARVKLVGVVRKDLMSYCQQGAIFQVLRATAE